MSGENRLMSLAEAVADGVEVDWVDAESSAADANEREAIRKLQLVAEIVRLHQVQADEPAGEDPQPVNRDEVSTHDPGATTDPQFWGPLKILERVGSGRFGTVYRALDPRLDREVALKLLHACGSAEAERASAVVTEGRLLAQIRHPNVVTVFGADSIDGRVGLWMELVSGRTLLQIQREQGVFSAQEAALVGLTLCSALAAVHKKGFLHRDIKAQNVMRETGGRIVLMDFGAGEQLQAGRPLASRLKGTPVYLAPELLDEREASAASDIYALGVLLFYLVTGGYPFEARDLQALRDAHRARRGKRLHDVRPELPDGFVRTVECALDPDRKRRFASAGAMQFSLAEMLGLRFAAESIGEAPRSSAAPRDADLTPSIAVLPFTDMSHEKDQAYLCEGIAEELINALSMLPGVHVAARSSAFQFGGAAQDIRAVGERLNVQNVLEGSVRKSGNRLRITAQLIEVRDGYHLWSERYDRDLDDVFAVQDEIARAIVAKLRVRLRGDSYRPLVRRHTDDLEAYNLYLQGRYYWSRRYAGGLERAIEYFTKTIAHDESYALAHAGLAESFCLLGVYDLVPPHAAISKAKAEAERALQLDDTLSEAHEAMALVRWYFDWDFAAALAEYKRALDLNPSSAVARALFGILLADLGRFDEARVEVQKAVGLEPVSALIGFYAASATAISGPLEDALPECRRTLDLDPTFLPGLWTYATILSHLGRHDEAIEVVDRAVTLSRRQSFFLGAAGRVYAAAGRDREADAVVQELHARESQTYVSPLCFAEIAAVRCQIDEAFRWLERACRERTPFLVAVGVAPFYDTLRGDPRFPAILGKVGLDGVLPPKRRR
jgi:TolB-like protein/Tfp pilus assembly protein PilF